jgi:hypothetical protein
MPRSVAGAFFYALRREAQYGQYDLDRLSEYDMTPQQFISSLKKLGYRPQSKKAAEALGVSVRQLQRWGSGENEVTPTIERLLDALLLRGDPKQGVFQVRKMRTSGTKKKKKSGTT